MLAKIFTCSFLELRNLPDRPHYNTGISVMKGMHNNASINISFQNWPPSTFYIQGNKTLPSYEQIS